MKNYFILLLITVFTSSCFYDPPLKGDLKLKISNLTNENVYCIAAIDTSSNSLLKKQDNILLIYPVVEIPAHETRSLMGASNWEDLINMTSNDSSINILVFNETSIEKTGQDFNIINKDYLKKYTFKVADLEKIKWNVSFKKEK